MNKGKWVLIILIFFVLTGCSAFIPEPTSTPTPLPIPTPTKPAEYPSIKDEYAIYSEVIDAYFCCSQECVNRTAFFIYDKKEITIEFVETLEKYEPKFNPVGWEDFKVLDNLKLERKFNPSNINVVLLNPNVAKDLLDHKHDLSKLNIHFRGYSTFSQVAFHPYRKEAVVYFSNNCGMLCGLGLLYYLEFIEGEWDVVEVIIIRMS